jgi:hypothetical protein
MTRRNCKGTNRTGGPCKAAPLINSEWCAAHDPTRPEDDRFGSKVQSARAGASEKPRTPGLMEVLRARVEAHADEILAPYFKALGVGVDRDGNPIGRGAIHVYHGEATDLEDLGAQIEAAERLIDRVFGKPRQTTELTGPEGGPIEIAPPVDAVERAVRAAELIRLAAGDEYAPTAVDENGDSNGAHGNGHR